MFLYTIRKKCHDVINQNPYSTEISRVSASNHMCGPFLISYCGNKLWYGLIEKIKVTNAGPPTRFWGCRGQKYQMSWRMTQRRISRKTTLAKGDFRKSRGEGYGLPASLQPSLLTSHHLPFVRGPVISTKKIRGIERSMTVKQYQHSPGSNIQHELFVVLYHSLKFITLRI